MTLPNFIVIGAAKAGTTSLYTYLRGHPEIFMPERKELDFFVAEHNWERGLEWYERWFDDADSATMIGEASPRYTMYPRFADVPERIASTLEQPRLIYVVRNPIDRMISHYQQRATRGRARSPVDRALLEEPLYLDTSRYGLQLECYLRHFSADRILIVITERLRHDREQTLAEVFRFLGVDPDWRPANGSDERNVTAGKLQPRRLIEPLTSLPGWNPVAHSMPGPLKVAGRKLTHRRLGRFELSSRARHELEMRLRDDIAFLRRYTPSDFDGWGIA